MPGRALTVPRLYARDWYRKAERAFPGAGGVKEEIAASRRNLEGGKRPEGVTPALGADLTVPRPRSGQLQTCSALHVGARSCSLLVVSQPVSVHRRGQEGGRVEQLANERIQRFLAGKQVVVLATVQPDGAPLAMPMWFLLGGDRLTMVTIAGTQKVQNLRRDPRCCVVAEAGTRADIRGVTVQGRAEFVPDWADRRSLVERLLERYSPDLEHRWGGRTMPADRVLFHIVPHKVRSWDLPA